MGILFVDTRGCRSFNYDKNVDEYLYMGQKQLQAVCIYDDDDDLYEIII